MNNAAAARPRTVLTVEDDDDSAALLASNLRRLGYDVIRARTGEDALRMIALAPVDLVIVDLLLPGMDGWAVIEALRSRPNAPKRPIIVCSVLDRHDYPDTIDAALPKPYTRRQIEQVMGPAPRGPGDRWRLSPGRRCEPAPTGRSAATPTYLADSVMQVRELTLRAAMAADAPMLYELHKATMRPYVEAIYGPWDDEDQRARFDDWLRFSHPQVIQCGTEPVGVIDWVWREEDLYLGRIEVRPDLQGSGIGTRVLRHLAAIAAQNAKPLVLEVIDINPARRLYERLGFAPVKTVGRNVPLRLDTCAMDVAAAATARLREA